MKSMKLTAKQRELFEVIGLSCLAEYLQDLFYFEVEGFGDWKISDLIEAILEEIESLRNLEMVKNHEKET